MLLVFLNPTSLSLLNSELICRSYGSFGPSGSTAVPSGSTAQEPYAAVPLCSGSTAWGSSAVVPLRYRAPTASTRGLFFSCRVLRH